MSFSWLNDVMQEQIRHSLLDLTYRIITQGQSHFFLLSLSNFFWLIAKLMILIILSYFSDQLISNYTCISSLISIGRNVIEQFAERDLNIYNVIILMSN